MPQDEEKGDWTMTLEELRKLFSRGRKRCHLVGSKHAGVVAGLDLEGRLFAVLNGEILNRVNAEAILGTSTRDAYLNPGGDGLWPAPEGSRLGYEYATGAWRVPPGLSGARYWLVEETGNAAIIRAEIDLVNDSGLGIPTAFERRIEVNGSQGGLTMTVTECIEYLGVQTLAAEQCLLAPWTLAQFDCGPGCEVQFPEVESDAVWDLYDPSAEQRSRLDGYWHTRTDGSSRYQIGLGPEVDWIEFIDPKRGLRAYRSADPLPDDLRYIDITDRPPDRAPKDKGIRFSVYSDTSGFMEIEAAGGCPETLTPGFVSSVTVRTAYSVE